VKRGRIGLVWKMGNSDKIAQTVTCHCKHAVGEEPIPHRRIVGFLASRESRFTLSTVRRVKGFKNVCRDLGLGAPRYAYSWHGWSHFPANAAVEVKRRFRAASTTAGSAWGGRYPRRHELGRARIPAVLKSRENDVRLEKMS
jgi:hypothetical protein